MVCGDEDSKDEATVKLGEDHGSITVGRWAVMLPCGVRLPVIPPVVKHTSLMPHFLPGVVVSFLVK